ncbi:MAG: Dihydrolipoyl dehydrogenase [Caldanaerobacter subterraneus]|uniref:Dihydrolipoyl dehydrogenase n=3 Tax=Caldanaerobacter subterraneus TaxID=911092 RepID=Q8R9D9_CALS4|nr:dihydrolipoyl dehydrogenase [Caldanaerobacter subterraneus]AAM24875.1 Dihydrolipoamide dehydrogenase/glutathione oxidoreductase and related enzymes [Caldanaerobacter subterraneus subsp. tengcongensis MB4]ERM92778.1 dihydrolipoamide dehydrogenase [Caldanaerobacter subterraneus subsp. yonseiensis KB-1]KUK08041.1 MAG: Dihydrolipoyl dehydrogenase [Caldanaerobacter subterraneus]MCS3915554.1 dihydrolipoamide dehydrogenase [Caldanaerobacter subterraneus subsp. tengcongensis MB4]TCO66981.1 dihydrol
MNYDVIVVGGGPGGYTAAIRLSELGKKVALIEEDSLGGTCLNRGCIPTKVYAHAAELVTRIKEAKDFGITAEYTLDIAKLRQKKERVVKRLVGGVGYLMNLHHIDVINGKGTFIDKNTVEVNGAKYTAENFIIATGSKVFLPPIEGIDLEGVMTSDKALELEKIPEKIVIIGAGIIGLEFANIYASLGSKVIMIEMLPQLLPMLDRDVVGVMEKALKKQKIELHLNSKVEKIERGLRVIYTENGNQESVECDAVLVAVGRVPNVNGVDALNLEMNGRGIKVDSHMRTSIENIYAIGDVTGGIQLAHVASYQGIVAAHNIAGEEKEADLTAVPNCLYTNPEVAWVGLNESQAREKYGEVKIGTFPYTALGRAMTMGESDGFVKIIAEGKYGRVVGMEIIGAGATEIIHEGVLAIKEEFTLEELADSIHAHPTLSESIKEAAEDALGMPINKG